MADAPGITHMLVATGGGGLIGGMAAWAQGDVRIVSVEPAACPALHDALKAKFRGREDITTGLVLARSTKTGSDDFWQYVDSVRHWSHTFLGLYIPDPNEYEEAA
jgi:threonine dehydratase